MGGVVSAVTNLVTAPLNAVTGILTGGQQSTPTPPPPPAPLETPTAPPGADTVKAAQNRIRRSEALRGTAATGTTANILTGVKGDTSLTDQNKKNLLGS